MRQLNPLRIAALSLVIVASLVTVNNVMAKKTVAVSEEVSSFPTIALEQLPPQGRTVYSQILQGGPFTYDKDGVVFGNRERLLPANRRGYYHEYTVKTPGARNRGARRIICGGQEPQVPDACFYTEDHYSSFRKIVP